MVLPAAGYRRVVEIGSEILTCEGFTDLRYATMRCLKELTSGQSVVAFAGSPGEWHLKDAQVYCGDRNLVSDYLDLCGRYDPLLPQIYRYLPKRKPLVVNSSRFMSDEVVLNNPIYKQIMKPRGLRHTISVTIPTIGSSYATFCILRSDSKGDFTGNDLEAIRTLLPFIQSRYDYAISSKLNDDLTATLDWVAMEYQCGPFAMFDAGLQFICSSPANQPVLAEICRDVQRPPHEQPTFVPDLRVACRGALTSCGRSQRELSISYTDPSRGNRLIRIAISKNHLNHEDVLMIRAVAVDDYQSAYLRMGGDCLTKREKSVAGLAALGFTNQEIARKLAISSSTVASHVSSILAKIGISERSQLMHKPGLLAKVERLSLGARERQILLSRLTGVSTAATAKRFHICQTTVRNYMRTIYRKLGVAGLRGVIRYLDQLEDPSASRPNLA